jgi:phospholipid-translocating ATPase
LNYQIKKWEDIRVGDFIKIEKENDIPADILLLKSSLESGLCFLETMNLDGETNLKERMTPKEILNITTDEITNLQGVLICDHPNENLEKWECNLRFIDDMNNIKGSPIICRLKQLLMKGCKLKNTEYVYGVVVYTGHNTKIMKNAKSPPLKKSNVMRVMNRLLYSVFIFQIMLCILFGLLSMIWIKQNGKETIYLDLYNTNEQYQPLTTTFSDFIIKVLTFLVAYSHLIPISLYVALEFVKIIQTLFINKDDYMYDSNTNKFANARTSELIEELGQVEFIFSDKTGTLTKNEMEFKKCSINNKIYGSNTTINSDNTLLNSQMINSYNINGDLSAYNIMISNKFNEEKEKINNFFICMSLCHSAYVEQNEKGLVYQSSSPDEIALLMGASKMGYIFKQKTSSSIEILNFNGEYQIWDLLLELPFDSTRKRMSVIVKLRNNNENKIYLFTKGADSSMFGSRMNIDKDNELKIKVDIEKFAREGLRTLVFVRKEITEEESKSYINEFNILTMSNDKEKESKIMELYDKIEYGFDYLGSSAIEDKLQDV